MPTEASADNSMTSENNATVSNERTRLARKKLTSGPLLARNTIWNLAGQIAPMAVAAFAIPKLIHALGTDRFGALTIVWMVVGYFSFFDFGLGRAMTNLVAQDLAGDDHSDLPALIWTSNLLMGLLGILGGIVLACLSPVLVRDLLKTPLALQKELIGAFYVLSASVPFVTSNAGFRGILEARQRFGIINIVRIPMGVATFAAPLLVLPWTNSLIAVVDALLIARILYWAAYIHLALRDMPVLRHNFVIDTSMLPKLFGFGAWMTVSNIVSPIMSYMDRLLVGVLLSLSAVAYYATPFEVATKLFIIPGAIVGVLFPAFSTALASDLGHASRLFQRAVKYVFMVMFPATLLIVLFAQNGLSLWLGTSFASHSATVMQWLAVGVLANSLATLPFALIQGAGRADITGKLHLAELPVYLVLVWFLTRNLGIQGTAIAWTLRTTLDCFILFGIADLQLGKTRQLRSILMGSVTVAVAFSLALIGKSLPVKLVVAAIEMPAYLFVAWFVLLAGRERAALLRYLPNASLFSEIGTR